MDLTNYPGLFQWNWQKLIDLFVGLIADLRTSPITRENCFGFCPHRHRPHAGVVPIDDVQRSAPIFVTDALKREL